MNQSFGKAYKLCSKTIIDEIFESGRTAKSFPLIAKYKLVDLRTDIPFQVVISAPKRTFRNAFQRNRVKRLCTEAIRKNKHDLETHLKENNLQLGIFLIYTTKEELTTEQLEKKSRKLFNKIIDNLHEKITH